MNLIIEYFTSSNPNRDAEFKTCITENIKNKNFTKIFIFISDDFSKLEITDERVEIVHLEIRPTFDTLIKWCNENLNGQTCIISNTDIFFDETISHLKNHNLDGQFLALTRWDLLPKDGSWYAQYYNLPWRGQITTALLSQDSWIFKAPLELKSPADFPMGKLGCDNRIVQLAHEAGYDVRNPSMQIVTKHLHISNHRTYSHHDVIPGPYLLVAPTNDVNLTSQKQTIPHF